MGAHQNNFNLIRLFAATQVLIVHVANHFNLDIPLLAVIKLFPGVPIFFFISGFLIYSSFDRLTPSQWGQFYFNRILRIYPGLIVCTVVSVVAVYLTGYFAGRAVNPFHLAAWLLGQVTIFQFYNPPFMREFGTGVLNGALWTISVEVQFYVLVPVLYWLLRRHFRVAGAVVFVSLAINVLFRIFGDWDVMRWKLLSVSFLPWIYMFLVGCILSSRPDWQRRVCGWNLWLIAGAFVASMVLIPDLRANSSNSINPLAYGLLAAMVLRVAFADLKALGRPFQKTDLSYGLYLYHVPIINVILYSTAWTPIVRGTVTIVAAFVAAILSWTLIERPALDLKRRVVRPEMVLQTEPGAV